MLKLVLVEVIAMTLLISCSKSSSNNTTGPGPLDTLSAGWTMSSVDQQQFTNIHFVQNNGVVVSTSAVYSSSNGGQSWEQRLSYGNYRFGLGFGWRRNIGMDSAGNVIIPEGLYNGDVNVYSLVSSHDFNNFTVVPDSLTINDNSFLSNNTGYGITANQQDTDIHFVKTINGGDSWTTISTLPRIGTIHQIGVTRLAFINSQIGWVSTPYGLFKTTDGGLTWTSQYIPPGIITNISAVDVNTCYIEFIAFQGVNLEIDKISKSTDGGSNWQEQFTVGAGSGPVIESFQFVNASTGYMTRGRWIYKSTDGGVNWNKVVAINSASCNFYDIYFTDANHGWACSGTGQILRFQQ